MLRRYSDIMARLCSVLVIIQALFILLNGIVPILITQPSSALVFASKYGFQLFVQVFVAYFSLVLGILLANQSHRIWQIVIVITVLIGLFDFFLWKEYSSFYFALFILFVLVINHKVFNQDVFVSYGFMFITSFLLFALLYGVIGVYLLRTEFNGINSFNDAIYFCIVTYSTVGFGDIYPKTAIAKYFVISMIIMGLVVFTSSITMIAYAINVNLKKVLNNINKGKFGMKNHVLIVGYGILAKILVERYQTQKIEFLVIDPEKHIDYDRQRLINMNRLLIAPYLGHNETFVKAQAELAQKIIIAYDTDEATIFATMNTREYLNSHNLANPPKIIARVLYDENVQKAKKAGADEVVAPHLLAAQQILGYTFYNESM